MAEPSPHTAFGPRKRRALAALLLLAAAGTAWWLLRPRDELGERMAAQLEQVAAARGIPLKVDSADSALLLGEGDLTGLVIGPLRLPSTPYAVTATVKRAHVRLEPAGLIRGLVDLRDLKLSGVELRVEQAAKDEEPARPQLGAAAAQAKQGNGARSGATPTLRLDGLTAEMEAAVWRFEGRLPTADETTRREGRMTLAKLTGPAAGGGGAAGRWQGTFRVEDDAGWTAEAHLEQGEGAVTRLVGSLRAPAGKGPTMELSTALERTDTGAQFDDLRWVLREGKTERAAAWATAARLTAGCRGATCEVEASGVELAAKEAGQMRLSTARLRRTGGDVEGLLRWGTKERGLDLTGRWLSTGDFSAKFSALAADPADYFTRDRAALDCPPVIGGAREAAACTAPPWKAELPLHGQMSGTLRLLGNRDGAELEGEGSLSGGTLALRSLSARPIEQLDGRLNLSAGWSWRDDKFWVERATVTTGAAVVAAKGFGDLPGQGSTGEVSLHMEPVEVNALRDSLPKGMMPWLDGATMSGKVGFEALVRLDAASPGLAASQFELLEEELHLANLSGIAMPRFEEGRIVSLPRPAGSGFPPLREGSWASLRRLPRHLVRTILAAEDDGFFSHRGFDWRGIQRAMAKDYAAGAFVAGGSTITQQVAKNLFLSSERSLSRKLQETLLTYLLEQTLTKEQVLEVYLNTARFGRDVVGVEAAARHYFGRPASSLSQAESLALAAVLPSPVRFGAQLEAGKFDDSRLEKLEHIVANLERDGSIGAREAAALRGLIDHQQFSRPVRLPSAPVSSREEQPAALP